MRPLTSYQKKRLARNAEHWKAAIEWLSSKATITETERFEYAQRLGIPFIQCDLPFIQA